MEVIGFERLFIGIIFVVYGSLNLLLPKQMFKFRAKFSKVVFGVTYKATSKTYKTFKSFGVLLVIVGMALLLSLAL